jgi:uncharacterized membrane protein
VTGIAPLFAGVGLLISGLGIPLWLRKVRPNRFYGVRTSVTLGEARAWYEINAAAGRDMVVIGVLTLVLALVAPAWGIVGDAYTLLMAGALIVGGAIVSFGCFSRTRSFRGRG